MNFGGIRLALSMLAAVVLVLVPGSPVKANATVDSGVIWVPIDQTMPVRCDGTGELVRFTGSYLLQTHHTTDSAGGLHGEWHVKANLRGVGLESGTRYVQIYNYQETGPSHPTYSAASGYTIITITQFIVQGEGTIYDTSLFYRIHATITPGGEHVIQHEVLNESCE